MLADLIRALMAARKITVEELSGRLGYKGNGSVSMVLLGRRPIHAERIPDWIRALRLTGAERDRFEILAYCTAKRMPDRILGRIDRALMAERFAEQLSGGQLQRP
jgi:transcriptional regulator with XRE-family HTH domain